MSLVTLIDKISVLANYEGSQVNNRHLNELVDENSPRYTLEIYVHMFVMNDKNTTEILMKLFMNS